MLAVRAALVVGLAGCTYCTYARLREVARDVYYDTGSAEWYRLSAVSVLAWTLVGYLCVALLIRG